MAEADSPERRARALLAARMPGLTASEPAPPPGEVRAALRARAAALPARPLLRTVHHFACTGGTLISRCIAALPAVRLLSEVDPLSRMGPAQDFLPNDLIGLARHGARPPGEEVLEAMFLGGLEALRAATAAGGMDLVLRDHAHSQFCFGADIGARPTLLETLQGAYEMRALVTVRHPLDSYLSLLRKRWTQFSPATLPEYARRYHAFLDRYEGCARLRYEDFLAGPEAAMREICAVLELRFAPEFTTRFAGIHLSGDSGRRGGGIAPRPRRPVPEGLMRLTESNAAYRALCTRLGYDPAA